MTTHDPSLRKAKLSFADRATAGMKQLPGVQNVAITSAIPLTGETWVDNLTRPDHPLPLAQQPSINLRWIDEDYLSTDADSADCRTQTYRCRPLQSHTSHSSPSGPRTKVFRAKIPLGRRSQTSYRTARAHVTVVGVVADARVNGLKDTAAMVYIPYWAFTPGPCLSWCAARDQRVH